MRYHVCVVRPEGYVHSGAFTELAELVVGGLRDLGHVVSLQDNALIPDGRNILIGCHLLGPELIETIPPATIILNTEQIFDDKSGWNGVIIQWASRFETWDYSERNMAKLQEVAGVHAKLLKIGYHNNLARIVNADVQDIDVLFYGSINERRQIVLKQLKSSGINAVSVFGVYEQQRDALIARSKIILNLHYYPSHIFEIVRVFYLMINAKAVVSEVGSQTSISPLYLDGICSSSYEGLVDTCRALLDDDALRRATEQRALETIRRMPQSELMIGMLDDR